MEFFSGILALNPLTAHRALYPCQRLRRHPAGPRESRGSADPVGRQRSNMRGAGKPAKMLISGTPRRRRRAGRRNRSPRTDGCAAMMRGESGERSFPERGLHAGALHGALPRARPLRRRRPCRSYSGKPVAASRRSSSSSNGSGRRLAGFSPTPRLTAMYGRARAAAARAPRTASAPATPSVSPAQAAASSGSVPIASSPPYARLSNK